MDLEHARCDCIVGVLFSEVFLGRSFNDEPTRISQLIHRGVLDKLTDVNISTVRRRAIPIQRPSLTEPCRYDVEYQLDFDQRVG